jgi:peptide chain release factor 1
MIVFDERMREMTNRYEEILSSLSDPAVISDQPRYQKMSRELAELEPVIFCYRELVSDQSEAEDVQEIFQTSHEEEIREMAREELSLLTERISVLEAALMEKLTPQDPNDRRSVIIEIRAGAGGEEAALFVGVLFRMYSIYAQNQGWRTEFIDSNETEIGGYKEIVFSIEGQGAFSRFKYESGVHRVQRVPVTESSGRVHTSTVTVAVLPEADPVEVNISPNDLKIDTFRASGAGGQHVNRTESAIRITHLPTGIIAQCQDERSQYKNKDKAMAVLMSRLMERETNIHNGAIAKDRKSQVGTGDRSERIRTYNFHQGRVTDHRIGLTLYRLEEILNGDLGELISALTIADKKHTLGSNPEQDGDE